MSYTAKCKHFDKRACYKLELIGAAVGTVAD